MSEKSPYKTLTLEEVRDAEASLYVIQLGVDFYIHKGKLAFPLGSAEKHFYKLYSGLTDMLDNGTNEEKELAFRYINNFRIMPLRIN